MLLKTNRVWINADAGSKLKILKGRTGLTPNILCRLAICMSLNTKPTTESPSTNPGRLEFNKYTLLGDYEPLIIGLIVQYLYKNSKISPATEDDILNSMKWHISRGVNMFYNRVKNIHDVVSIRNS